MAFRGRRSESKDSDLSLTPEQWDERARGLILARLTRGPRSKRQLAQLLEQRGVPEEVAVPLLDRFEEVGLIDDEAFARAFANDRRSTRGLAKSALKRELSNLGVAESHIEEAICDIQPEDDLELATALVRKRWPSVARLEADARYRRLSSFLARRGFSGSAISAAIRAIDAEAREAAEA